MKRALAVLGALLLAAAAPAANTQPDRRDVQVQACGNLGSGNCLVPMGSTVSGDLITVTCCGKQIISPVTSGFSSILANDDPSNVAIASWWKIADGSEGSSISMAYEPDGKVELCALVSYKGGTFNSSAPIDDSGTDSHPTNTTGAQSFNVGAVAVTDAATAPYAPVGAFPSQIVAAFCGSDNGSGGFWASNISSGSLPTGWSILVNTTTNLGDDKALAVAIADKATAGAYGPNFSMTSSYSLQYAMGVFNVAAAPGNTPTNTYTPSVTPTPTITPTETRTFTPASTSTPTSTGTITNTPTITPTPTDTGTATETFTPTNTRTVTRTPTVTRTATPTNTGTVTSTPTSTRTITPTVTRTSTATETVPPNPAFLVDDFGNVSKQSSWTMPEDEGLLACFLKHPGISQAMECFGVNGVIRYIRDALGNLVAGNPAPNTLQHDATFASLLSGRTVIWGRNPYDVPSWGAPEVAGWQGCTSVLDCLIQSVYDFQGPIGPLRHGLPMRPFQPVNVTLPQLTLDGQVYYFTMSGAPANTLEDSQTRARTGCYLLSGGFSALFNTARAVLPANCSAGVGFVVNGSHSLAFASMDPLQSETQPINEGGNYQAWSVDDDHGIYAYSAGAGCLGAVRDLSLEYVCGGD